VPPETYGDRLRRLRLERGLSMRDVASPGASPAYICRLEMGQRTASVHATRLIAAKLGVPWQHLETGESYATVIVDGHALDVPEAVADELHYLRAALGRAHDLLDAEHGHSPTTWADRQEERGVVEPVPIADRD
jgi:transcriptional regulator with XRE-family HTH domain